MQGFITREEALQAVLAALMFGENAGIAALCTREPGSISVGAGNLVSLADAAIDLLRVAQIKIDHHSPRTIGEHIGHGVTCYDLRNPNRVEVM